MSVRARSALPRTAAAIACLTLICLPALARGEDASASRTPPREPVLRVALREGADSLAISCAGDVRLWRRGSWLAGSEFPGEARFRILRAAVSGKPGVNGTPSLPALALLRGTDTLGVFPEELLFEPLSPQAPLQVDGRGYRGELLVRAREEGLLLINAVRIEDYLRGVVPLEIGGSDATPEAALQAQAIAARSYALFYLGRRALTHGSDLLASVEDQVYGGCAAETPAASQAVEGTRGIVAVHAGRAIRANYCAACGGRTEASARAWPGQVFPYLGSVKDTDGAGRPWCAGSRHASWEECWPRAEFAAAVLRGLPEVAPAARGIALGRLRDIEIARRSPSGRAEELRVETDAGWFSVPGERIRGLLSRPGGGPLRSTLLGRLKLEEGEGGRICLDGRGNGHGVGMCQSGALEMARRGRSPEEILRHYYRGIGFARWW